MSSRRHRPATILVLVAVMLATLVLGTRAAIALQSPGLLDWDETYYASTTATAAHGLGFFPHVDGYPQIPDMGGVGYVIGLYVVAYKLLGPTLLAPRLVSVLAGILAVAGVAIWTRRLHGSAAAIISVALAPSLLLFQLTNSIRLDIFVVAFVAWTLVLYARVAASTSARAHAVLGFVLAMGLEVHLHTASAAAAVGLACLVDAIRPAASARPPAAQRARPLFLFVAGYLAGVLLFVAINVLPNPTGYFRTAALARLSAADAGPQLDLTARMDGGRLAETFLSPSLMLRKERARYSALVGSMTYWERALWVVGLLALTMRPRASGVVSERLLFVGAVIGGAIVFNGPSPLYASALLPFFVPAAAAALTNGVRRARVDLASTSSTTALAMVLLSIAILPSAIRQARHAAARITAADSEPAPPLVTSVRGLASTNCVIAGPTGLYAQYFMAYPRFVGTRDVEVKIGSTYYDLQDDLVEYWRVKAPDVVFGPADADLRRYLDREAYISAAPDLWVKPSGRGADCRITLP